VAEEVNGSLPFLYKALDDAQSTIRSLDSKAGVGIVVLGAMIAKFLEREQLTTTLQSHWPTKLSALAFVCSAVLGAIFALKTVFPMINPAANVSLPEQTKPQFFIARLAPCRFLRLFSSDPRYARLALTHPEYLHTLRLSEPGALESVVAAEVLKVSFIRQMKTDRLAAFARALVIAILSFVSLIALTHDVPSASKHTCTQEWERINQNRCR
jgi:hypothetical protein